MVERIEPRTIAWGPFWAALVLSPLLVTVATVWITPVSYYALVLGGPVYLAFGIPLLIRHLRRHPPRIGPIVVLALVSLGGLIPPAAITALVLWRIEPLEVLPFLIFYGAIYGGSWAALFALIYRHLGGAG